MKTFAQICLLLLCSLLAHAEIYKWVDDNGRVHYSDSKPASESGVQSVEIREINSLPGVEISEAPVAAKSNGRKAVVMYSTTWCGVCKRAAAFFKANRIPYREYDVEKSSKGQKDFAAMNGRGVPVILVGGKRMNGFDEQRFMQLYK